MVDSPKPKKPAIGPRITGTAEPSCLFPDENEIAHCVLGKGRTRMWFGLAHVLERHGLPRIDPQFGGRYWPAVKAFLDRHMGLHPVRPDEPPVFRREPGPRTGGVKPRA
ncbi:hypothetical protein [Methylobacterium sp. Leaf100]|uniref:hypothetical protein n=1 Tax=Methylobacterium sp. Leaf100 TaxID=1736252 RepID=UPI001FCDCBDF|nr:hypothetical protein [Methylobacterium sp. Leaf100]